MSSARDMEYMRRSKIILKGCNTPKAKIKISINKIPEKHKYPNTIGLKKINSPRSTQIYVKKKTF